MRRIVLWLASTVSALVLMFSYHTSTSSRLETAPSATVAPVTTTQARTSGGSSTSRTVTGPVAQTQWGPVQVALTVAGGRITAVSVLQYPSGNGRDAEINSYALPILNQEAVSAQSASIDMVSGATVTSTGYLQSLQGAIDQAGL